MGGGGGGTVGKYKVSLPFENFIWLAVVQSHKFDNMRDGMCACWGLGRGYQVSSPFENFLLYSRYWYIWHYPVFKHLTGQQPVCHK